MLLCSKLRHLAIVVQIAFLYFFVVFFFPLDVTQLFKTCCCPLCHAHLILKTLSLMIYDYLYTELGCLQCFSHFTWYLWLLTEAVPVGTMPLEVSVIYEVNSLKVTEGNL